MDLEGSDALLNKESGLKGLSRLNDMRAIHRAAASGDSRAALALEVQSYRNRKYIGENDVIVRAASLKGLEAFGVRLDPGKNSQRTKEARCISSPGSTVRVFVIPTNEELAIAREVANVIGG